MNMKNMEFLQNGLKYLGFGEKLNQLLEEKLREQPTEFKLQHTDSFKAGSHEQAVNFSIDFKRSTTTDLYFMNRYQATLRHEDPAKDVSQTFYIDKNSGVTAKEAFNLLQGRAVNKDLMTKDGIPYNAWLQLDFSQKDAHNNFKINSYGENYGFDLEKTLAKYPIRELATPESTAQAIKSLKKGNLTPITWLEGGVEKKMFLSTNPQFKNLNAYHENGERKFQQHEKVEKEQVSRKESVKQADVPDDEKKTTKRKGVKM